MKGMRGMHCSFLTCRLKALMLLLPQRTHFLRFTTMGKTKDGFHERKLEAIRMLTELSDSAVLEEVRAILHAHQEVWWDQEEDLKDIAEADAEIARGESLRMDQVLREMREEIAKH